MNSILKRILSMTLVLTVGVSTTVAFAEDAEKNSSDSTAQVITAETTAATDAVVTDEATADETVSTDDTTGALEDNPFYETPEERKKIDAELAGHKFTGREITKVPEELLEPDAHGGKILRFEGIDFRRPGTKWKFSNNSTPPVCEMRFVDQGGGVGYHEYIVLNESKGQGVHMPFSKENVVPIKPNRKYILALLAWTDFNRVNGDWCTEICTGARMYTDLEEVVLSSRHGLPDYTDGWKWLEFEFSPGLQEAATMTSLFFNVFKLPANASTGHVAIADACIIEMPEVEPRKAFAEGEGVTFRGSAGDLDMRVEGATQTEDKIVVETTGTTYTFDLKNDTITSAQKIGKKRDVSVWNVGTDLSTLKIRSQTEKECVITNPEVTFGVQMDGILFMTPHKGNVSMKVTSLLSGLFNRYAYGHLTVLDGYGGFTVTPDISMGSGLVSDCQVLTPGLDFVSYAFQNQLYFDNETLEPFDMNNLVSNCKKGFQFNWNVRPGERLAISTFPPREYDWEASFGNRSKLTTFDSAAESTLKEWQETYKLDYINLWHFDDKAYAAEWTHRYTFSSHEDRFVAAINNINKLGMKPIEYITAYFFEPENMSPEPYINEVRRLRDSYGITGVYSDGTPSEWRWIVAYEQMRMLRELFPDGYIEIHQTGIHENGGPPLSSPSFFIPGLDTYASDIYKGEGVGVTGINPAVLSMTWNQMNVSNARGSVKWDRWHPLLSKTGELGLIDTNDASMIALEWNVRKASTDVNRLNTEYFPAIDKLKALWKEKGDDPDFYEKYWQPLARELGRPFAAKYGYYEEVDEKFDDELLAKEYGFHGTEHEVTDGGNGNNALKMYGSGNGEGTMLKRFAPIGGPLTISYKFKVDERGNFEHAFSDVIETRPMTLRFGKDGKISLGNKNGYYVNIGTYKKDEWIDVCIDIDTDKHTVSITINGKKIAHSLRLPDNFYNVSEMEFSNGGVGAISYFDDLKVINKY